MKIKHTVLIGDNVNKWNERMGLPTIGFDLSDLHISIKLPNTLSFNKLADNQREGEMISISYIFFFSSVHFSRSVSVVGFQQLAKNSCINKFSYISLYTGYTCIKIPVWIYFTPGISATEV